MRKYDALGAWRANGGKRGPTRSPMEKLADNPTSLRLAVNAKCYDCQGLGADTGWQARIRECGVRGCPLNAVRPYQRTEEGHVE